MTLEEMQNFKDTVCSIATIALMGAGKEFAENPTDTNRQGLAKKLVLWRFLEVMPLEEKGRMKNVNA